uniref:Sodium/hydrogen exchanger n=1 Tax=Rhabditophanes sp. KR3021 TaxID=114890 RepID=A0AC35UHL7_9BILA
MRCNLIHILADATNISESLLSGKNTTDHHHEPHGIQVASFRWEVVKAPLVLTIFIVAIGVFKLVYHQFGILKDWVPESCCLILLGVVLGAFFVGDNASVRFLNFDADCFFFILLPPIIFEAALSLKDNAFIDNIGTIMLYAFLGTIFNIIIISGGLISLNFMNMLDGFHISPLDALLFGSLISAVDPVAVLSVLKDVGVNKMLYFMVFGESLFNDAVTVVCYNLVIQFKESPQVTLHDIWMGFASFICVAIGGAIIGLLCGILSSFISKYTTTVRVVEPVIVFGLAYLSYMTAELFHWSGIIAIIVCGLFQAHYTVHNLSKKSTVTINTFAHVMSAVSESLIFIILGVMIMNGSNWIFVDFHFAFSAYSLILCIVGRFVVTFLLTSMVNYFTGGFRYISFQETITISYGGLRGAVSFSLAFMLNDNVSSKGVILSATYVVILFTVFFQGSTIKLLVQWLNIKLAKKEDNFRMFIEFNKSVVDRFSEGIEEICGKRNSNLIQMFRGLSKKYLRPKLQRDYFKTKNAKMVSLNNEHNVRYSMMTKNDSHPSLSRNSTFNGANPRSQMSRDSIVEHDALLSTAPNDDQIIKIYNKKNILQHSDTLPESDALNNNLLIRRFIAENTAESYFYLDKNMVQEDEMEERHRKISEYTMRVNDLKNNHNGHKTKKIFGIGKSKKRNSIKNGLIVSSLGTFAISANNQTLSAENSSKSLSNLEHAEEGTLPPMSSEELHSPGHAMRHLTTIESMDDEDEKLCNIEKEPEPIITDEFIDENAELIITNELTDEDQIEKTFVIGDNPNVLEQ